MDEQVDARRAQRVVVRPVVVVIFGARPFIGARVADRRNAVVAAALVVMAQLCRAQRLLEQEEGRQKNPQRVHQ